MRRELAAEIGRVRDAVADAVADAVLTRHPDWTERHDGRAVEDGVQDARHHIDFLQAAVELNDPTTFRDHALWSRDLLDSRGAGSELLTETFAAIRDEMSARLSPLAAQAVDAATRAGIEALAVAPHAPRSSDDQLSVACRLYIAASISGRRAQALTIVREAVRGGASPTDVYIDIFQSALYEVGRRWETAGLTVAEEHMATATTQFILSVLQEELPGPGRREGTAVVTGVVNERHVVGASIVANVLDAEGWDVRFMGSDLPHDTIVAAIDQYRADLVAISVTMSERVPDARDLIAQVRRTSADPPRIIVGGAAFLRDPQLWRTIGADGYAADARGVAELART